MLSTDDKRFIIKSVENGYKVSDLAKMFNVTPRRVQQILKEDVSGNGTKRKFSSLSQEEAKEIEDLWINYKIGSRTIYYLMKSKGKNVSYYQIYNFMRNRNMIRSKGASYQNGRSRNHEEPLSTIYMDYHQSAMDHPYAVVCVDMATKKILSIIESRKITKEALQSLVDSISEFTNHTTLKIQNLYLRSGILSILYGATDLRYYMKKKGVVNVEADKHGNRVHLALSRLWQNYDKFRWTFGSPDSFMFWYNNRPVISKMDNQVTTPNEIMERYLTDQQSYPIASEQS
ncbi:MAG: IS481 family transposase [Candidatus Thermoplasmatota archaeon]|nr:IS481 family transposase [Candidatus Thermoplasmatota archaeon]MCL6090208.1 IS481 family transposase [Candidatus Thermoplasmatota archaeon]MDA8142479.1 IS481 family transposase [Thermoplasmatales archaeon]